jgi:hypothetical protein
MPSRLVDGVLIEITEHQRRCEWLGVPEDTPEAEVNALYDARQAALIEEKTQQEQQRAILEAAAARLAAFDPNAVPSLFDNIEDPETRQALEQINNLIADIRVIVMAVLK